MGRRKIEKPQANEDTIKRVKQMIKEYPQRKYEIYAYEHSKVKMKRFVPIGEPFVKEEVLNVQKYKAMKLPTGEKNALLRYFEDREIVFLLESGMATVPEGRHKDIADDKIFNRLNNQQIMEKYDLCYETVRRVMREIITLLSCYLDTYLSWKSENQK